MKKVFASVLAVAMLLLPSLVTGCGPEEPPTPPMPPLNGGQEAVMVEISIDDFTAHNQQARNMELIRPGSLIVSLGSNPSTGFQWTEAAEISAPSVIEQDSHNFVEPQATGAVGAAGKDVWVFNSLQPGSSVIKLSYSRPWEGGEKDQWTLTLNVTVK